MMYILQQKVPFILDVCSSLWLIKFHKIIQATLEITVSWFSNINDEIYYVRLLG